jgi:hypothetical protein
MLYFQRAIDFILLMNIIATLRHSFIDATTLLLPDYFFRYLLTATRYAIDYSRYYADYSDISLLLRQRHYCYSIIDCH